MDKLKRGQGCVTILGGLAVFAILADYVTDEAEKVGLALYTSSWHAANVTGLHKPIGLVIQKSNRPLIFRAGGLIEVNSRALLSNHLGLMQKLSQTTDQMVHIHGVSGTLPFISLDKQTMAPHKKQKGSEVKVVRSLKNLRTSHLFQNQLDMISTTNNITSNKFHFNHNNKN